MTKYIYHSENTKTTCNECKKNDGKVFYNTKDIPQLPIHPNCKCFIEVVEDSSDKNKQCDCKDRLEVIINNTCNVIDNTKNLIEKIDSKANNAEFDFEILAKLLEELNSKKDTTEKEVGSHNKDCSNNVDNLYKEIKQNITNAELLNKKQEELSNKLYALRRNLAEFDKEAEINLIDIDEEKKYFFDPAYHTKEQCKLNEKLTSLTVKTKELCKKINDYSIEYNEIKEKLNDVKDAIDSMQKLLEIVEQKRVIPCGCKISNTTLQGYAEITARSDKEQAKKIIKRNIYGNTIGSVIGPNYNRVIHETAKKVCGKDTAGMLDLAHGINMNDRSYIKDVYHLENWDDPAVTSDKEYLNEKITKQFKDYNFNTDKIKGYFFKNYSEPVQNLIQNQDFRNIIKNHKKDILEGKNFSAGFPKYGRGILFNNNWHNAIGMADFRHPWFDKQGNLHIKMYDTYDFNKNESNPFVVAGSYQQDKGSLKPFFTIHDIIIPANEVNKIFEWVMA